MSKIKLSPARIKAGKAAAKIVVAKNGSAKSNGNGKPDFKVKDLSLADWGRDRKSVV